MTRPIEAGCLAEVVGGMLGAASPNLGLIVRVLAYVGDHSQFGRIWRCEAEFAELGQQGRDVPGGRADFAQDWLKRIDPPASEGNTKAARAAERIA